LIGNYLKSALRNIKKQKWYSLITLTGLTIGMTCFVLISLYVRYELSYDEFHPHADRIYRAIAHTRETYRGKSQVAVTPAPLASAMEKELAEVLKTTKVMDRRGVISIDGTSFPENRIYYADPSFLEIFSFPLAAGDAGQALNEPYSLLISRDMTARYFGSENPLGKTIQVDQQDFTITGILENIPGNTHFKFDHLASFSSLVEMRGREKIYTWNNWSYYTYALLHHQTDLPALEKKLNNILKKNYDEDASQNMWLQPVADIHLHTKANFELESGADIRNVHLLSVIGIFILLIACFNYMNLATARSTLRAREIGMRKVIGASRRRIIRQFLGESCLFSLFALICSCFLIKILLPAFRNFIRRELEAGFIQNGALLLTLAGLTLFIGLISGSYPALVISSFQPTDILAGKAVRGSRKSLLFRNSLVIAQFAVSAALIFCTITVYRQLHFIKNKDVGFSKDHIVTIRNPEEGYEAFKNSLLAHPQILEIAESDNLPYGITNASFGNWEGHNPEEKLLFYRNRVSSNFLDFYNIPVIQGRGFSREFADKDGQAYILNEAAVKTIGWENPIGQSFGFGEDKKGIVVGVIKDFHFAPLHLNIGPLALTPNSEPSPWISIKITPKNIPRTLALIEETWKTHSSDGVYSYSFLDDRLDRMYRTERRLGKTFSIYTFIALFIACLGLFGLASFTTEQRTKEIGIRKVLGASEWNITLLTTKKFMLLVLMANIAAGPLAGYAMKQWLDNFAYRIHIGAGSFALAAASSFLIALMTVGYQSLKAALSNPVNSLRSE